MNKRGNFNLSRPSQIPGKEVTAIRRRAVLTVRMNLITIEKKDIQPPETGTPKGVRITSVSSKGLNIPMKMAKGAVKQMAKSMTESQLKDYATKPRKNK